MGLPYVLNELGAVLGVIGWSFFFLTILAPPVIALGGALSTFTLYLLHNGFQLYSDQTYEAYASRAFGRKGSVAVSVCVIMINFGSMIGYQIIILDLLTPLFCPLVTLESDWLRRILSIGSLLVLSVLSLPKQATTFKWVSILSLMFVAGIAVTVVAFYARTPVTFRETPVLFRIPSRIFSVFGVVVFSFACHSGFFPIVSGVPKKNQTRITSSILSSAVTCGVIYLLIGIFGYLTFTSATLSDVMRNYPDTTFLLFFRVMVTLSIVFTFPLSMIPARVSVDALLFSSATSASSLRFGVETITILLSSWIVAVFVPRVGVVFNLTGALFASMTSFVFPAAVHLKNSGVVISIKTAKKWLAHVLLIIFGFGVAISVTAIEIYEFLAK